MNDWADEDPPRTSRTSAGMCKPDCACQQEDAYTTDLDPEEFQ